MTSKTFKKNDNKSIDFNILDNTKYTRCSIKGSGVATISSRLTILTKGR